MTNIVGILCGECRNNLGVSVLQNKCVSCHETNVILIPALGNIIHNTNAYINTVMLNTLIIANCVNCVLYCVSHTLHSIAMYDNVITKC